MKHIKTFIKSIKSHIYIVTALLIIALIVLIAPLAYDFISTSGHKYDTSKVNINSIPYNKVGIVFGAGILANGQPTTYLKYRLDTAINLYKAHRISILLMSGDNSIVTHNEPLVMKNYAVKNGVAYRDIVVDYAGFDTYDTCYRAHKIFGLTKATLIAQGYFLPRAMTTCKYLGVDNIGVASIHPTQDYTINYLLREFISTDKMVLQLVFKPNPKVLGHPLSLNSSN